MSSSPSSRLYRKVERARREEETRLRITEAAVELHGAIGPAKTTVADIARRAGVSRMTVYNHFPTGAELFAACSTHWAARNPFPDPTSWSEVGEPAERLIQALGELYEWYERKQNMLGNVFRDVPLVPALGEVMADFWSAYVDGMIGVLAQGWTGSGVDEEGLEAALRLAIDFNSWRVLTESGLDSSGAAELAARMVTAASTGGEAGPADDQTQTSRLERGIQ